MSWITQIMEVSQCVLLVSFAAIAVVLAGVFVTFALSVAVDVAKAMVNR